ncbi:MAG: hypothetical protein ACI9O6_000785 [Glaciecola sp.]|jgi:hypothetical protein|mmetsp:Transcript_72377/g.228141  ORF Transcript_72377/g.228141 Transcript_72377/m.228141 type:complete len:333 (+) Transcript_72377:2653-3651(+)
MSDNYLDWTSLLEKEDEPPEPAIAVDFVKQPSSEQAESAKELSELLQRDDVSEQVKELVKEHIELKQNLDALTGKAPAEDNKNWNEQRFGFPQHTVHSRIKDRKRVRYEERLRMLDKRRLENAKLGEKQVLRNEQLKQERLRDLANQRSLAKSKTLEAELQSTFRKNEQLAKQKAKEKEEQQRLELRQRQRLASIMKTHQEQKEVFENLQRSNTRKGLLQSSVRSEIEERRAHEEVLDNKRQTLIEQSKTTKREKLEQERIEQRKRESLTQARLNKLKRNAQLSQQELNKKEDALRNSRQMRRQEINQQEREARRKAEAIQRRREQQAEFDK